MRASGAVVRAGKPPGKKQADGGDQEDCGEGVGDPGEVGEECEAPGDEEAAQQDRAGDSPEEDAGLVGGGDLEEAEEEKEDEEIVDGERLSIAYPARYGAEAAGPSE